MSFVVSQRNTTLPTVNTKPNLMQRRHREKGTKVQLSYI